LPSLASPRIGFAQFVAMASKQRRKSVEWAQWTHDQNQEMLSSMKMEAQDDFASPEPGPVPGPSGGAPASGAQEATPDKISKLLSRQGRSPAPANHNPPPSLPRHYQDDHASPQRGLSEGGHGAPGNDQYAHRGNEETSYLEAEISHLKEERGSLLEDQAKLIAIIQSDNAKLMEILNEVKISKQKMVTKIETLEKERVKLKAFSAEVIENNVESILSGMPLSVLISSRADIPLEPAEEVGAARQLCHVFFFFV
jgi:hypothetical protein